MRIAIGPHTYTVTSDEATDEALDADDEVGHCVPYLCEIAIHSKAALSMQRDALVHEVLHAVWYASGLSATDTLCEEQVILAAATPLLGVLQSNPALIEFLTS